MDENGRYGEGSDSPGLQAFGKLEATGHVGMGHVVAVRDLCTSYVIIFLVFVCRYFAGALYSPGITMWPTCSIVSLCYCTVPKHSSWLYVKWPIVDLHGGPAECIELRRKAAAHMAIRRIIIHSLIQWEEKEAPRHSAKRKV